jgi:hypothetical protein
MVSSFFSRWIWLISFGVLVLPLAAVPFSFLFVQVLLWILIFVPPFWFVLNGTFFFLSAAVARSGGARLVVELARLGLPVFVSSCVLRPGRVAKSRTQSRFHFPHLPWIWSPSDVLLVCPICFTVSGPLFQFCPRLSGVCPIHFPRTSWWPGLDLSIRSWFARSFVSYRRIFHSSRCTVRFPARFLLRPVLW